MFGCFSEVLNIFFPFICRTQCRSKGNIRWGGGGTSAPEARAARGVWGHAPPENFEIYRLGNAISSVLQGLFVIYAYRELFTSFTVSANQCTLGV